MACSALYVGRVTHRRVRPRAHSLAYRVFWMLLDLDELDGLAATNRLFSVNRANVFSFFERDYGERGGAPLKPLIAARLAKAGIDTGGGPIRLLTMPRILGYAFNPLSVFFCHHDDGRLAAMLYEVHNTFGETHTYLIPADGDERPLVQESDKAFHVSPFMDMGLSYRFRVLPPEDAMAVAIEVSDPEGPVLFASMSGRREAIGDGALARLLFTHPLLTLKVTAAIHWHALLLVLKRIRLRRHPGGPNGKMTVGRQAKADADHAALSRT
jgi:DUF1365 family protein